jgi:hypothetical protein
MNTELPGLISRKIIARDRKTVTIEEVWDVTVPGCPMITMNPDVKTVTRRFKLPKSRLID